MCHKYQRYISLCHALSPLMFYYPWYYPIITPKLWLLIPTRPVVLITASSGRLPPHSAAKNRYFFAPNDRAIIPHPCTLDACARGRREGMQWR
eukprot:1368500-Amorphochlora_amoeboformis.AAC.1